MTDYSEADHLAALQALKPRGLVWPQEEDAVQTQVFAGLAKSFARTTGRATNLLADAFPATAVELLPEWQKTLGLPDGVWPMGATLAEQQAAVATKFANTGGQSAAYFEELAASLGYTITVQSAAPFRCGQSKCGQSLGTTDQFYVINVQATDTELQALLETLMPGHATVNIRTP